MRLNFSGNLVMLSSHFSGLSQAFTYSLKLENIRWSGDIDYDEPIKGLQKF